MGNKAAFFLANYMEQHQYSVDTVASCLAIPREKFRGAAEEPLMADELLRLCAYLHIQPEVLACKIFSEFNT